MKPTDNLLGRLRQETEQAHRRLDSHPVLRPLSTDAMEVEEYRRALRALYAPQNMLEALVLKQEPRLLSGGSGGYVFRPRVSLLASDLADMSEPLPWPSLKENVLAASLPAVLGYLYVLEGSRMGARLIQRQVRAALGGSVPCRFFSATHADGEWQAFRQFMESECPPGEEARVCSAAQTAFSCFLDGLERVVPDDGALAP